jgi:hypothetical protein
MEEEGIQKVACVWGGVRGFVHTTQVAQASREGGRICKRGRGQKGKL